MRVLDERPKVTFKRSASFDVKLIVIYPEIAPNQVNKITPGNDEAHRFPDISWIFTAVVPMT